MEPQDNQTRHTIKNQRQDSDDEQEVHIIDSKTKQFTVMKLKEDEMFADKELAQNGESKNDNIIVSIKNWATDRNIVKLETHYFQMHLSRYMKGVQKKWEIQRRYSDFEWLFNALKYSYPGCILPYMPVKSIQNYMLTKMGIQIGEEGKEEQMHLRKSELQQFINGVCSHPILKKAEQTNIFLSSNKDDFLKNKSAIEAQIEQAKTSQSSTNGIVSMFERGIAWITSNNASSIPPKLQQVDQWTETEGDMKLWIKQFSQILEKIRNMIEIKAQQIEWQGPDTQVDAIEQFKAKIISGRQYNQLFLDQLEQKILRDIEYQSKWLKQLQEQLTQRQSIISIINYIFKYTNDTNRCNKLIRKKEKFQVNMIREWAGVKLELKEKIRRIHKKFNEVWKTYCQKMHKIWKMK